MLAKYKVKAGDQIQIKMAISYVSLDNAKQNLESDVPHWDFDKLRKTSQNEWNNYFSRVDVKGGSDQQKIKFYTDVWHTLLGRHKLDDSNGQYPDYFQGGRREGAAYNGSKLTVRTLSRGKGGKVLHICTILMRYG
jgi:putative alpha-1,2-mannosidase